MGKSLPLKDGVRYLFPIKVLNQKIGTALSDY